MRKGEIIGKIVNNEEMYKVPELLTEEPLLYTLEDEVLCELLYYWGRQMDMKVAASRKEVIFAGLGESKDQVCFINRRRNESHIEIVTKEDFPGHLLICDLFCGIDYDQVKEKLHSEKIVLSKERSSDILLEGMRTEGSRKVRTRTSVGTLAVEYNYSGKRAQGGVEELMYFKRVLNRVLYTLPDEFKYIREEDDY